MKVRPSQPTAVSRQIDTWRLIAVLGMATYFVWAAQVSFDQSLIGTFNLIMHEAGHWVFGIFGRFLGILGGSLMQVLVPFVFAVAFFGQRQPLGVAFCLMWTGQSSLEVATYAGDAVARSLPLLGGEAVVHDWHWLLLELGWLSHTEFIAAGLAFASWFILGFGIAYGLTVALGAKVPGSS